MNEVILKPHQEKAVKDLDNGKILVGGVGSGKTYASLAYYIERESPKDLYVITTARKRDDRDWESEAIKMGIYRMGELSDHGKLTVDSWNNIGKYVGVKDAFFIFDEQRVVGSGAWTKSFYKIAKSNRWILLSATPGDTWLDYVPVFVANGFYKNPTEFKRRHVVYSPFTKYPKVLRYLEPGVLVRRKNSLLIEMPFERHTTRHIHNIEVDYDRELLREVMVKRWNPYLEKPMKDIAELFRVSRKIVNGDPRRLEAVRGLMEKHPRLIVFYNFDYELEQLRTLGTSTTQTSTTERSNSQEASSDETGTTLVLENGSVLTLSPESQGSQRQRSISTTKCDQCNPENPDQPCDPIIHGEEPEWSRAKLSSLVSSSSEMTRTIPVTVGKSTALTTTPTGPISTRSTERGSTGTNSDVLSERNGKPSNGDSISTTPVVETSTTLTPTQHEPGLATSNQSNSSSRGTKKGSTNLSVSSCSDELTVAEWNGHKHEPVPTTARWVYLVQYTAGAEGWNCITTDAMVMYSLTYSYKTWHQAFGRIDRLNTPYFDLNYYVLQSKSWIDLAIRKSLNAKKSFNEASFGVKSRQ